MEFLPLFHNLRGSRVLVVGGGEIALRKSRLLADAGAVLRVVAPQIESQLRELVLGSGGELMLRGYQEADLDGCTLIIAATDDEPLNAQVSSDAKRRCVPVNVVDAPALCSVIFPAIVDRSPLVIAVSSGGDAPVLARLIRAKLETWIPSTYGQLAGLAARFRAQVKGLYPDVQQRRAFWEEVFQGPIADRQLAGQGEEAERLLIEKVNGAPPYAPGEVYLVGAGPGDPDLLTFRALRLMQQADVVLYDRLVAPAILELCRRDAERVYVGKRRADHAVPQDQINQQLVDLAKQGKRVLRLKGGPVHLWSWWRRDRRVGGPRHPVPGGAGYYGSQWLRGLCRDSADSPRLCPICTFYYRALEERYLGLALARPGRPLTDPGVLHGLDWLADHLRAVDQARARVGHPSGADPAGHHVQPARVHRHPGRPAAHGGGA